MTNISLYLQTKYLITLCLFVSIIPRDVLSQKVAFSRTLQNSAAKRGVQSSKHFPFLYKFINMLEFLIHNIFVDIEDHIVQQINHREQTVPLSLPIFIFTPRGQRLYKNKNLSKTSLFCHVQG